MRTISGSVWGGIAQLEEDLSIGALDADTADEYIFGDVTELTPDGTGGVYVFDRQVPAIRHYDRDGRFLKTLGRKGQGPGEYGSAILGMVLRDDGQLVVYDAENGRINFYAMDGEPSGQLRLNISGGLYSDRALQLDSLGYVYVRIMASDQWPPPDPWPVAFAKIDARGQVVDTIGPPMIEREPADEPGPDDPMKVWAISPYVTVVGINDVYAFEIRRHVGGVVKISRTTRHGPVAYRDLRIASDGRIWVTNTDADTPTDELTAVEMIFDVFEPNGDYLGKVRAPARTTIKWIGSDSAYGVRRGRLDEQYVVRLVLTLPPLG